MPAFSSETRAVEVTPARGASSDHASQRGASGPAVTGCSPTRFTMGATLDAVSEPLLVRAARREEVERTPVWFMRQAGRSLPEYRAIREKHAFFEVAHTPELCAEVTLQPVRRHDVDAAVMFADIMTPVLGMGIDVRLVEGVGPVIDEPVRTLADVERLRIPDPEEAFAPVLEAVAARTRGAAARSGRRRLLRRPVHGRRVPRRGEAEPRVRAHEEPHARASPRSGTHSSRSSPRRSPATSPPRCARAPT